MITKEINLGKVAPVGKRGYSTETSYDVLDIVSYHGQSYMSLHADNAGNDPSTDSEERHWMLLAERGESWYQMCVRTGRFTGTEEEFLNDKQKQIDDATAAAKIANKSSEEALKQASNAKVQADRARDIAIITEELYALVEQENSSWMAKEQARENAELARVNAETLRAQAETNRVSNENTRVSQEETRQTKESERISKEDQRNAEENTRKANETERISKENERISNENARKEAEALREQAKTACIEATEKANEASNNANDTANHPTYIGADFYVYVWDKGTSSYTKTSIFTRGKNFSVYKTYESVDAMQADLSNVPDGEFVLISNDNMEDVDNAKLYVRTSSGFNYLVDMSGAMGFTGKTPQISVGSVTVGNSLTDISVSLSPDGTDADGNPCFLLNVKIPVLSWTDLTEEQKDELRTPLAEEINTIKQRAAQNSGDIERLIESKDQLGEAKAISLDTEEWPTLTGLPVIRTGDGAPAVIPDFVGQKYADITNRKLYFAFGVSSVSDWVVMN